MNSIFIAMFALICGLVVFLMYQINKLMELQYDLIEQHDEIRKIASSSNETQLKSFKRIETALGKNESSVYDLNHNIDMLHEVLNDYGTDILVSTTKRNTDVETIYSYLEIMKNTIIDMNDKMNNKMNKPTYGGEISDPEYENI